MTLTEFESRRQFAETPAGRIAYIESGTGPVALFLHGRMLNGYFWRHQLQELGDVRRCIAVDLLAHGATECTPDQDVSYDGQAAMLKQFLDVREIDTVDLVGNDSGTAIAQIFAANHRKRVRSLILTDGDTFKDWPPLELKAFLTSLPKGRLRGTLQTVTSRREIFRSDKALGLGYERAADIADATIDAYLRPFLLSQQKLCALEQFCDATLSRELMIRFNYLLCNLYVPTLIIWATDEVGSDTKSQWMDKAISGIRRQAQFKGARLYFPEERWDDFNSELRNYWRSLSLLAAVMWARIP
jgi:pimeloyl-ACP methyl ester carboxylesterase